MDPTSEPAQHSDGDHNTTNQDSITSKDSRGSPLLSSSHEAGPHPPTTSSALFLETEDSTSNVANSEDVHSSSGDSGGSGLRKPSEGEKEMSSLSREVSVGADQVSLRSSTATPSGPGASLGEEQEEPMEQGKDK